jgi:hypothetical protein
MFYLIASTSLVEALAADEVLSHNSLRFTTKPDLRETVMALADWHRGRKSHKKLDKAYYDLFTEPIPDERTCADAEVPHWFCSTHAL